MIRSQFPVRTCPEPPLRHSGLWLCRPIPFWDGSHPSVHSPSPYEQTWAPDVQRGKLESRTDTHRCAHLTHLYMHQLYVQYVCTGTRSRGAHHFADSHAPSPPRYPCSRQPLNVHVQDLFVHASACLSPRPTFRFVRRQCAPASASSQAAHYTEYSYNEPLLYASGMILLGYPSLARAW